MLLRDQAELTHIVALFQFVWIVLFEIGDALATLAQVFLEQ